MKDSKLLQMIRALSEVEVRQVRKFLLGPAVNRREDVRLLFDYCAVAGEKCEEKLAWAQIAPGTEFDLKELRRVMNYLQNALESWIAWSELENSPAQKQEILLRWYRSRETDKPFRTGINRFRRILDQDLHRDAAHFHAEFQYHFLSYNAIRERGDEVAPALQAMSDHLDTFFVLNKLKVACAILTSRALFGEEYELKHLQEVIERIENDDFDAVPAIQIYYKVYRSLREPQNEVPFRELCAQIREDSTIFTPEEMRSLYLLSINYCIRHLNQGKQEYLQEVLELYREALERDILLENGLLSPWTYKNICSAGLKSGDFEWVEEFIEAYRWKLQPAYQENFYQYNLAELKLAKGDFAGVVRQLRDLSFRDPFTALNTRLTLIKAWYELDEFALIEYQLDSLQQQLRRKDLTYHKEHYKNFIRFTRKLLKLMPGDVKGREKLAAAVSGEAALAQREWLVRKIL